MEYHRLGFLILVYVFLQFIYRGGVLISSKFQKRFTKFKPILNRGIVILAVLLILDWIIILVRLT